MPAARMGLFTVHLLPADRFVHIDIMSLSAFFRTGLFGIEPVSAFHYSIHIDPIGIDVLNRRNIIRGTGISIDIGAPVTESTRNFFQFFFIYSIHILSIHFIFHCFILLVCFLNSQYYI